MVVVARLNYNVWVKGWLSDPVLTIIYKPSPSTDKTINFQIVDVNGVPVSDPSSVTLPAGSEKLDITLGDYIDSQQSAKGFGAGQYFILVKIVEDNSIFALPLFISLVSISDPPTGRENLEEVIIIDKVTGSILRLPKSLSPIPADDRYELWAYYHNSTGGRLVKFDRFSSIFDTGYHKLAVLKITVSFQSYKDMLYWMLMRSYNIPESVLYSIISEIESGNYDEAIKLLLPLSSKPVMGKIIKMYPEIDPDNNVYRIVYETYMYLGEFDWGKIIGSGLLGCALAAGTAIGITVLTAGAGAISLPLVGAACGVGAAASMGVSIILSSSHNDAVIIKVIDNKGKEAKDSNNKYYNDATGFLQYLKNKYNISDEDYNRMLEILNNWKATMDKYIDELVGLAKDAYNAGKRESERNKIIYAVAGLSGGALLAVLLGGRR